MQLTEPVLDADHVAFMRSGVSISLATCSADKVPLAMRGLGCRIAADRSRVTVFTSARQAGQGLHWLRDRGRIAVVFSDPPTHRTMQVKGIGVTVEGVAEDDFALMASYKTAFLNTLAPLGFDPALVSRLFQLPAADVVALSFTPTAAFSQTPGPRAGELLRGTA